MRVNAETMTAEINSLRKEMRNNPFMDRAATTIHEENGVEIQIVATRDPDDKFGELTVGIFNDE